MRPIEKLWIRFLAAFSAGVLLAGGLVSASFQDEGGGSTGGEGAAPTTEKDDGKKRSYLVVSGGDIHTGTGEVLRGATLLAKNGKIERIGYDIQIPGKDYWTDVPEDKRWFEVQHLDATGMRVYPGLVAISSQGLVGTTSNYEDQVDPFNQNMILGLASGITTTGQGRAAVKLKRYVSYDPPRPYDPKQVVVREGTYVSLSSGSAANFRSLREKLARASAYLRDYRKWEEEVKKNKDLKEPDKRGVDTSILSVLKGESYARFRSSDRNDILAIARVAQDYGFRPIIEGCRECWTVADELGRAGAMAILTPRERRDKEESLVRAGGSSIENAAILYRAGVPVAIQPAGQGVNLGGIVGRDIMHLPVEVGFAIRGGLPEDAGLASMTLVPARMMGIAHRVGSLEVGKDCDLIVTDGDVLHYQTFVQYAVVDGELVYDKQQELYFAHIRPRPDLSIAPERRVDRGETPEEAAPAAEEPAEEVEGEKPVEEPEETPEEGEEPQSGD